MFSSKGKVSGVKPLIFIIFVLLQFLIGLIKKTVKVVQMEYITGGFSACCACLFSNIFDVIKTRQQLQGELMIHDNNIHNPYRTIFSSMRAIVESDGLLGLQKGLSSALAFQFVLNCGRLGLYQHIDNEGLTRNKNGTVSPLYCVFWGATSGVFGSTLACPFYMVKTQMQSQTKTPGKFSVGYQHDHSSTTGALLKIYRKYGFMGLWRGYSSIIPRTSVGSAVQLSTFSTCKEYFSQFETFRDSYLLTAFASSIITGFFTCVAMTPFDCIATRLFNQGTDPVTGKGLLYKNIFDCFAKSVKIEGPRALYKGFFANYCRQAPHTLLHLTCWEQFKKWTKMYNAEKN